MHSIKYVSKTFVLCFLITIMQSCISTNYKPVTLDSPAPSRSLTVKMCEADIVGDPIELHEGQSCFALVRANEWLSPSNLRVSKNQRYVVAVTQGQFWFDKDRRNTPDQGDEGSRTMNLFKAFKREQGLWFILTGATVECTVKKETRRECDYASEKVLEKYRLQNDLGNFNGEITVRKDGYLAFYPNDAVLFGWRIFYKNNHGQVWLQITRMIDVEHK